MLIKKMILNCLKQYYSTESMPVGEKDLEGLIGRVLHLKEEDPTANLHEIVNDTVYEFLTG
ncbi:YqzH family protein [Neobacillus rhizosphaerae]|uniref:YqzH family protein n=1 Tax=Neobacillus rhizosphaerae TaxID=2880965 RepID=UPI003D2D12A4